MRHDHIKIVAIIQQLIQYLFIQYKQKLKLPLLRLLLPQWHCLNIQALKNQSVISFKRVSTASLTSMLLWMTACHPEPMDFQVLTSTNQDLQVTEWITLREEDQGIWLEGCEEQKTSSTQSRVSVLSSPSLLLPKLLINEALINPSGNDRAHEFIELANPSDTTLDLSGISIFDQQQAIIEFTAGCMPPKTLLTIYGLPSTDQAYLPYRSSQAIPQLQFKQKPFTLSNRQNITLSVYRQAEEIDRFEAKQSLIQEGVSLTRIKDGVSGMIVSQRQIDWIYELNQANLKNRFTPGRCNQNGLFENSCEQLNQLSISEALDFDQNPIQLKLLERQQGLKCMPPNTQELLINELQLSPQSENPKDQWIELLNTSEESLSLDQITLSINQNPLISFHGLCMPKQSACLVFINQQGNHILCPSMLFKEKGFENQSLDTLVIHHGDTGNALELTEELTLMLVNHQQRIIDQSSVRIANIQPFMSFNRLIDGVGGGMILHQQNDQALMESMLRRQNGQAW